MFDWPGPYYSAPYFDRSRSPRETVALVQPHFERLGISRVARQTGLDRIGIPCYAAIRPNSRTLATNQGKGIDDDAALASAVMEAAEYAIAEDPGVARRVMTIRELLGSGDTYFDCRRMLPVGEALDPDLEMFWIQGAHLATNDPIWIPADAVVLGDGLPALTSVAKSTNGLASGNTREEAVLHGLCELVERDAATLWSFRSDSEVGECAIEPTSFNDPVIDQLRDRIVAAGMQLSLFDMTSDIGVPVIHAVIGSQEGMAPQLFDACAGTGCHPMAERAAVRAITEAAQSRITNIAGARDDFDPAEYGAPLPQDLGPLRALPTSFALPPSGVDAPRPITSLISYTLCQLWAAGVDEVVIVPLGGEDIGISVVRVLSSQLEDGLSNRHWWPGPRALCAMRGTRP